MPVLRMFGPVAQSGARFPGEVAVRAPRGLRLRPGLPRGFSRSHWRNGRIAKREPSSRKTIRFLACGRYRDGLLFRSRRRGNPPTGQNDGRPSGWSGWKVGTPAGRSNRRDGKPEGRFNPKPKGNRRRRAVGRPSGDPSGSSSGLTASRPQGLQPPRKRGERSSDRTAAGFGQRRSPIEVRSPAGQRTGLRTPRGLRLRPRLPRGFSRLERHGPESQR